MSEAELLRRLLARDSRAEREFYDAHAERVFRLAYRICGDAMLAEDLTQDTFVRAFAKLPGFRGRSSLGTWLYAVAMSVILNGRRAARRRRTETSFEDDTLPGNTQSHTPAAGDPALHGRLASAVNALPSELRMVVLMYDVEGFSHDEIAVALDISPGASRMRLSRARVALRAALTPFAKEWMT